jgi:hypothetical protein
MYNGKFYKVSTKHCQCTEKRTNHNTVELTFMMWIHCWHEGPHVCWHKCPYHALWPPFMRVQSVSGECTHFCACSRFTVPSLDTHHNTAIHDPQSLLSICKKMAPSNIHFTHHAATPCCHLKYLSLHWMHKLVLNSRLNLHLQYNWVLKMASNSYPEIYVHTEPNIMAQQQNALPITFIIQSNPVFPKWCSARNFHCSLIKNVTFN